MEKVGRYWGSSRLGRVPGSVPPATDVRPSTLDSPFALDGHVSSLFAVVLLFGRRTPSCLSPSIPREPVYACPFHPVFRLRRPSTSVRVCAFLSVLSLCVSCAQSELV